MIPGWLVLIMSLLSCFAKDTHGSFQLFPESGRQATLGSEAEVQSSPLSLTRLLLHVQRLVYMLHVLPCAQLWRNLCFSRLTHDLACNFLRGDLVNFHRSRIQTMTQDCSAHLFLEPLSSEISAACFLHGWCLRALPFQDQVVCCLGID